MNLKEIDITLEKDILALKEMEFEAFKDGAIDYWVIKPIIRHGKVLKFEINNNIVGFVELIKSWDNNNSVYIFSLMIGKKMQNLGYGKKMLSKLIEYLDKENINIVSLTVSPDNKKAIHIYEKYGFVRQEIVK